MMTPYATPPRVASTTNEVRCPYCGVGIDRRNADPDTGAIECPACDRWYLGDPSLLSPRAIPPRETTLYLLKETPDEASTIHGVFTSPEKAERAKADILAERRRRDGYESYDGSLDFSIVPIALDARRFRKEGYEGWG